MSRHDADRRWVPGIIVGISAAGFILAVGLAVLMFGPGAGSGNETAQMQVQNKDAGPLLPTYATVGGGKVAAAYQFALDRPDVMLWMPCYCGCGEHSGHRNARDCFIKAASSSGNVQFEEHGSACNVCVDIALRARELTLSGWALNDIRAAVDREFGHIGPGTDTPLPQ